MRRSGRYVVSRGFYLAAIVVLGVVAPLVSMSGDARSQAGDPAAAELRLVMDGLTEPVYIASAGDGSGRLFVVEKAGTIRIIQDGELLAEPFLDISDRVDTSGLERGMLGLVFHPDYVQNGLLYLIHVPDSGAWSLEQYTVSTNPNRVDPASVNELIYLPKEDHYAGHYGGMLLFGPDGYLYASIGDGGDEYDPFSHAQNLETLPGSILRLDVDGGEPYGIPDDNPFVDAAGARPEIWLYGLRNPWRFSFDRETGDLYIADVGHVDFEEVNFLPVGSDAGMNYGWPEMEGPDCSIVAPDCDPSQFEPPVHAYTHLDGCTIVGGYVYRQQPVSNLYGRYIFGDYCDGTIWSLQRGDDGEWVRETLLETDFNISSFGEDAAGRLYVTDIASGGVYEIVDPDTGDGPVVDRLGQLNIVAGGAACRLDIIGSRFDEGALVVWDGIERETERTDSERLTIIVDDEDLDQSGSVEISVRNPEPIPGNSNSVQLEVIDGAIPDNALTGVWQRLDDPVRIGEAQRSWTWGPEALSCPMVEPYNESPGGMRPVQYFPKGRLEFITVDHGPDGSWYVGNGLLASEMISGRVQLGDDGFEERTPAGINVAGDPGDPNSPAYSAFGQRLDDATQPAGTVLTSTIDGSGAVADNLDLATYDVRVAVIDSVTNHAVAQPFWDLMTSSGAVWDGQSYTETWLFENPYAVVGRPITEAYWANILVAGQQRDVLIQCFERRCLTYTPDNPPGWQVETGNAGQRYYEWRYGE